MDPLMNHFPLKKISISSTFTCLQLPDDVLLIRPLWFMFTDAAIEPNKEEVPRLGGGGFRAAAGLSLTPNHSYFYLRK